MNDERIRQILREGDPYAGEPGLSPEEIREMRRTVLNAIPDHRERRFRLLPALALAGAAAVAVLVAVLALRPGSEITPKAAPPRIATVAPAPAQPVPPPVVRDEERPKVRREPRQRRRAPVPAPEPRETIASAEETPVREIQFTTPGGTRILWTVAPGKASF